MAKVEFLDVAINSVTLNERGPPPRPDVTRKDGRAERFGDIQRCSHPFILRHAEPRRWPLGLY